MLAFGGIGSTELILLLIVVLLFTGGRMLPELGRGLGERARDLVLSLAGRRASSGPAVGKAPPQAPGEYFSEAAQGLLGRAASEATRLGHPDIRPEHMLLVLVLERDRRSASVLAHFDVGLDQLRQRMLASLASSEPRIRREGADDGVSMRRLLDQATREANAQGEQQVDPVHVLLSLIRESGPAGEALRVLGVTLGDARAAAARSLANPP